MEKIIFIGFKILIVILIIGFLHHLNHYNYFDNMKNISKNFLDKRIVLTESETDVQKLQQILRNFPWNENDTADPVPGVYENGILVNATKNKLNGCTEQPKLLGQILTSIISIGKCLNLQ